VFIGYGSRLLNIDGCQQCFIKSLAYVSFLVISSIGFIALKSPASQQSFGILAIDSLSPSFSVASSFYMLMLIFCVTCVAMRVVLLSL
jgi:hypothetical protein